MVGRALSRALALGALLLGLPLLALAHQGGVTGYAQVALGTNSLRYTLTLSQLPAPLLAAAGGQGLQAAQRLPELLAGALRFANADEPCAVATSRLEPPAPGRESVTVVLEVVCRQAFSTLTLRDDSFDSLGPDVHTLARLRWNGGESQFAFATESRELRLKIAERAALTPGLGSFFTLGLWHILQGYDHLMFLLALLLVPAPLWATVRIITAFTLAHSLTLGLTALDLLVLPARFIETTIALSIAWVAAENLWRRQPGQGRVWVTALFGLVHGCGFADLLRETGLPRDHLLTALFGFNLGVEAGQLIALALALPLLNVCWRLSTGERLTRGVSAGLSLAGLALAVARLAGRG